MDWVLAAAIALFCLKGAWRGFLREVFGLFALAGGVGASVLLGPDLAKWAGEAWGVGGAWVRPTAHAVAFLVPYVGLQSVGFVLQRLGHTLFLGGADRLVGAVFGAMAGVLLLGAGLGAAARAGWGEAWIDGSLLARPLIEAFGRAVDWASRSGV